MTCALSSACAQSQSLTVEIDSPPEINAEVVVVGPSGFERTIRSTTTFEDVPPGQYNIRLKERRKRVVRPVIDTIFRGTVEGMPARISVHEQATMKVRYELEPGSGHVWIPVPGEDRVLAATAEEISSGTFGAFALAEPPGSRPAAVAFRRGDLWVSLPGVGQVVGYDAGDLGQTKAVPRTTLRGVGEPAGLAFDSTGDLFVADTAGRAITRFEGLDEAAKRAATLPCEGKPHGIAFDAAGSLFVATTEPPAIVVFGASALAGKAPTPKGAIRGPSTKLVSPSSIAFDGNGDLWVTNADRGDVVRFDASALATLAGDADLAPSAGLTRPGDVRFEGLAFDNEGMGWISAFQASSHGLVRQVDMTRPTVTISTTDMVRLGAGAPSLARAAFDPPALSSPVRR